MGKHIACSLFLIFLLFFLPWLWGEPSLALEPEGEDIPPAADRPAPWAPAPVKPAILPEDENEESVPGPAVLPGDFRPGLRTPRLPETLLYDLDGKLITPSAP